MISKELLSEVINIKIEDIIDLKMFGKDLKYYEKCLIKSCCDGRLSNHKDSIYKSINIYELAHKCKEWAIGEHGFSLHSFPCPDDTYNCEIYKFHKSTGYVIVDWFNYLSEIEAIFKACQWILDNKKEGN